MSTSNNIDLSNLTLTQKRNLLELLNEYDDRLKYNKLECYFPDHGPYARGKYQKQLAFMEAGRYCKERGLFGGNRSGKSVTLCYETALHLTGLYPSWWQGKRFNYPINCWCASDSHSRVKKTAQYYLLGDSWDVGTGMLPRDTIDIKSIRSKQGVPNAIESVRIKHYTNGVHDGYSTVDFMSYEQGRTAFQGTSQDVIQLDEEPPSDVYSECLTRTAQTDINKESGIILFGFTPLSGLTETVLRFLPDGKFPDGNIIPGMSRGMWSVSWEDVPHIPDAEKKILEASYLPHEREARMKGIPSIGAGRIFTTPESDFVISPFPIPPEWPRAFGLDIPYYSGYVGCVWGAYDPDTETLYIYKEYKASANLIKNYCDAIKRMGRWIPGVIDPSAKRKDRDGKELYQCYTEEGLDLTLANNALEAGLQRVQMLLSVNAIKVFSTCTNLLKEYRLYSYDKKGEVKRDQDDHLLDALRYLVMSGVQRAALNPEYDTNSSEMTQFKRAVRASSRNSITGY